MRFGREGNMACAPHVRVMANWQCFTNFMLYILDIPYTLQVYKKIASLDKPSYQLC